LTVLAEAIRRFRPDVVLTYGGDPASQGARALARRAGAKVAFRLHNFAYPNPAEFAHYDAIAVPSAFSRDHHRTALGLDCTVVPPLFEPARVLVDRPDRDWFITFMNPVPEKGGLLVRLDVRSALSGARNSFFVNLRAPRQIAL
jgi:hypothetical protein